MKKFLICISACIFTVASVNAQNIIIGSSADWLDSSAPYTDYSRWEEDKTIYDPCPSGWQVPEGGQYGVWNKAGFNIQPSDNINKGRMFGEGISSPSTWYP